MQPHYHDTDTRVITRVYLRKSENIPGEKREAGRARVIVRDYFAVDSLIGKQLITGQESRYKILYPVASPPFFFPPSFSPYLALRTLCLSVSPHSATLLRPLRIYRRFLLTHDPLLVFLLSVSAFFFFFVRT